ncbi:MAG TPA: hypothetical protein VKV26_07990 [Dehalococcoidia bacterium]|nr:hypothetical protein [Dehalococcoidia bacterium]
MPESIILDAPNAPLPEQDGEDLQPVCQHHWRIASPNGATSVGTCKRCGAVREFQNSSTDSIWESDSSDGNRWRGRGRNNVVADVPAAAAAAPISEDALGNLLGSGFRNRLD